MARRSPVDPQHVDQILMGVRARRLRIREALAAMQPAEPGDGQALSIRAVFGSILDESSPLQLAPPPHVVAARST